MRTIRTVHATDKKVGMTVRELRTALHDADAATTPTVTTSWSGKIRTITCETDEGP